MVIVKWLTGGGGGGGAKSQLWFQPSVGLGGTSDFGLFPENNEFAEFLCSSDLIDINFLGPEGLLCFRKSKQLRNKPLFRDEKKITAALLGTGSTGPCIVGSAVYTDGSFAPTPTSLLSLTCSMMLERK